MSGFGELSLFRPVLAAGACYDNRKHARQRRRAAAIWEMSVILKYVLVLLALVVIIVLVRIVQELRRGARTLASAGSESPKELKAQILDEFAQTLDPKTVPNNLRDLIPFAERWGIGDDIARGDLVRVSSATERQRLVNALRGRSANVRLWLDSFPDGRSMPESAVAFMYMLDALNLAESGSE